MRGALGSGIKACRRFADLDPCRTLLWWQTFALNRKASKRQKGSPFSVRVHEARAGRQLGRDDGQTGVTHSLQSARTWVQVDPECCQHCRTNFEKDRQTDKQTDRHWLVLNRASRGERAGSCSGEPTWRKKDRPW